LSGLINEPAMSPQIDFKVFHVLLRAFADHSYKTRNRWNFFCLKVLMCFLILGSGLSGCGTKTEKISKAKITHEDDNECTKIYIDPDQMPAFPGGEQKLLDYIYKNLKYPESAIKNNIQGKVIVRFLVTKTGKVDSVWVIRSLYPVCDKEAVRVIRSLPKFTPGKQEGKIISVWYTIPIVFKPEK